MFHEITDGLRTTGRFKVERILLYLGILNPSAGKNQVIDPVATIKTSNSLSRGAENNKKVTGPTRAALLHTRALHTCSPGRAR